MELYAGAETKEAIVHFIHYDRKTPTAPFGPTVICGKILVGVV
jgi:hypothetical protein